MKVTVFFILSDNAEKSVPVSQSVLGGGVESWPAI